MAAATLRLVQDDRSRSARTYHNEAVNAAQAAVDGLTEVELTDLAEMYSTEVLAQLEGRSMLESQWQRWLNSYRGKPDVEHKTYPWDMASNLVVGLSSIYVDSVVARIMSGIFSYDPHWNVQQLNEQTADAAKPLERYLEIARTRMWDQYKVIKPACLELCKLGTAVIYNGWKDEIYYQAPWMGQAGVAQGRMTGPYPCWVPREDFLVPQSYADLATAPWIAHRHWFSWVDLQRFGKTGFFQNVELLKARSDTDTELRSLRQRQSVSVQAETRPEFGQWQCWQVWFAHDFDGDGYPEEYVMVFHPTSKTILRLRPNPYPYGMRPYVKAAFIEQEGQFDGIGIPEMVDMYQQEVSTIHNQRRDNAHIANTSMLKVRKGLGYTEKEPIFPGKMWQVQDPNDLQPVIFGQNYMSTLPDEQLTIALAEKRVGITDSNLGRENSATGRAAATTVLALLQEGTRRFDLNTSELRRAIAEQGMQICELWQTHGLPEPGEPYAPESLLEPEAAQYVRLIMQSDGVRGVLSLNVNVATAAVNQEIEKQSSVQLYQLVNEYTQKVMETIPVLLNPQVPPQAKEIVLRSIAAQDTLMQRIFQAHHSFDLDAVLMHDTLVQMAQTAMQQPQVQMQPQGPPPGGPPNA
jgi:hypothetical protein